MKVIEMKYIITEEQKQKLENAHRKNENRRTEKTCNSCFIYRREYSRRNCSKKQDFNAAIFLI